MKLDAARPFVIVCLCLLGTVCARAQETNHADTKAVAAASLSGRVVDSEGKPVAGAAVELDLDDVESKQRHYKTLNSLETDDSGAFVFPKLPEGWYLVIARKDGFAKTFRYFVLEAGASQSHDFVLRKPVSSSIIIRDEQNRPISGARLRTLSPRDETGEFWIRQRDEWETFGMSVPPSDETGHLRLPDLPEDAVVTTIVEHDDFAPIELKEIKVRPGVISERVMHPGVAVTLSISPSYSGERASEVEIDLRHDPFHHPSTVIWHQLPLDDRGVARLTVEPGRYTSLWLKHPDYFVSPWYESRITKQEFVHIANEGRRTFAFVLHKKVTVRGRVVDHAGQPVKAASLQGEIPNKGPDDDRRDLLSNWMHVGWAETDANGEYALDVAAGPVRVSYQGQGFVSEPDALEFTVAGDGSTVAPDLTLLPMPKITGRVVDAGGRPVEKAVVRLRGNLRWMQPVATDAEGRFELAPPFVPQDLETEEPRPEQPLVAFHPYERLAARTAVRLNAAETLHDITLTLELESPGALLREFRDELSEWERGELPAGRQEELAASSPIGEPAPPLDGTWLNISQPVNSLAGLRGKYVLLDFWFIGCGPCHGDLPSVKLLHELYHDHGVEVIAVHDNSAIADAVREHAAKEKMAFPIVV
ncbi:MAG: carboxypeptidase regulatory-like domain-containing protein, partial [Planctomycetota bacterium]|nr:carboxypeptidase regulatory-like domain-containing protein [Planctomycetota bacterium]